MAISAQAMLPQKVEDVQPEDIVEINGHTELDDLASQIETLNQQLQILEGYLQALCEQMGAHQYLLEQILNLPHLKWPTQQEGECHE
ncbi:MAG: hypothetical protein ACXAEN_24100 [Candidatus Thorarchaeota archaeon]|jgi:hypothetical protein